MRSPFPGVVLLLAVGVTLLAGCTAVTSSQTNRTERTRLLARLRASEASSQRLRAQLLAAQQHWAAAYPTGSVTVPGGVISQSADADDRATQLQNLRAKLERTRQDQQKLRAELRHVDRVGPADA